MLWRNGQWKGRILRRQDRIAFARCQRDERAIIRCFSFKYTGQTDDNLLLVMSLMICVPSPARPNNKRRAQTHTVGTRENREIPTRRPTQINTTSHPHSFSRSLTLSLGHWETRAPARASPYCAGRPSGKRFPISKSSSVQHTRQHATWRVCIEWAESGCWALLEEWLCDGYPAFYLA